MLASLCLSGAPATAADLTEGWQVLRGGEAAAAASSAVPAADDGGWVPLDVSRSREYRLKHFYEPGLPIWLQRSLDRLPEGSSQGYWVVSVPNR
ncbi:MAG TPA: hypothetical protein VK324_08880, partial [Tepidisphaeraceae bacterium]|nr:hypothetical protein [Tepidisphaeraceae bacterium]